MILGQDEAVMFPTVDLYDTGMMNMYANAVRELYQQGLKDYENFVSKYGDFTSPIANDVEYWNLHTMGPVMNVYNDLLANGIDPVRSLEGRAILAQTMRNLPYAKLNLMRESSKIAEEYLKNRGLMAAKGLWNEDFERFLLNGRSIEDWDTSSDGLWTRTSPSEYSDLNAATSSWVDNIKDRDLGLDPTGQYRVLGVTEEDLMGALTPHLSGFINSDLGRYHLNNAKKELEAEGKANPTDQEILQRLLQNIVTANHERVHTALDPDDYAKLAQSQRNAIALENLRTANDISADALKQATKYQYDLLRAADFDADGRLSDEERARYGELMEAQYQAGSGGSSSRSSSGGASNPYDAYAAGAGTLLEFEQNRLYTDSLEQYMADYKKELDGLYAKLTRDDKEVAKRYELAKMIEKSPAASEEDKREAKKIIEKFDRKRDANFIAWKNKLNKDVLPGWLERSTTGGRAIANPNATGPNRQLDSDLASLIRDIYSKYNTVSELTGKQKQALNTVLSYTSDEDNNQVGKMNRERAFDIVALAPMTGDRSFRHNSIPNNLNRKLKNKSYKVLKDNVQHREYGAGLIKGEQYNTIRDIATFDDPEVKEYLNRIPLNTLNLYGITKNGDGSYNIPIVTKNGHGFARADVDSTTDKIIGGVAHAARMLPIRQAEQLARINE